MPQSFPLRSRKSQVWRWSVLSMEIRTPTVNMEFSEEISLLRCSLPIPPQGWDLSPRDLRKATCVCMPRFVDAAQGESDARSQIPISQMTWAPTSGQNLVFGPVISIPRCVVIHLILDPIWVIIDVSFNDLRALVKSMNTPASDESRHGPCG